MRMKIFKWDLIGGMKFFCWNRGWFYRGLILNREDNVFSSNFKRKRLAESKANLDCLSRIESAINTEKKSSANLHPFLVRVQNMLVENMLKIIQ